MSNYFQTHESRWSNAYKEGDEKSLNLHLRKKYIIDEMQRMEIMKDSKILDIGCGTGEISFELESKGYTNIIAQDISQKFINIAKKKQNDKKIKSKINFSIGGVSNLNFENATFQLVIASGLIEWIRYDRWALQEIGRVLKLEGYLIVTGPNKLRLTNILTPKRLWNLWKIRKLPRVRGTFSRHWYSIRSLAELLEISGFRVMKTRTNGFAQLPPVRWNSQFSFKTFEWLQNIADKYQSSWIGKSGSNIIAVVQKPLVSNNDKFINNLDLSTFCLEYEARYQKEFTKLNKWKKKSRHFLRCNDTISNYSIDNLNKIMVIAPHPDDELIGCGGFLIKKKNEGAQVSIIYLSDGRSTSGWKNAPTEILNTPRYHEARNVCNSLNIDMTTFLDGISGQIITSQLLEDSLKDSINEFNPECILVPFINDPHSDHIESNKILTRALKNTSVALNGIKILSYEVWSFVPANIYYKIDDLINQKSNELMKYKTAMQVVNYIQDCFDRTLYHGISKSGSISHMEAFYCTDVETYFDLVEEHFDKIKKIISY